MACCFDYKSNGYTIQFQTRGVSLEEAVDLWKRIDPKEILDLTEETGHNVVVYSDSLALLINKNKKYITVRCGKKIK